MVNFDNVTTGIPQKPRKKTMAESLEEAKQEGRLVVPEEDKQENAVISTETIQSKSDKPKKKKKVKVRKDGEQTVTVSQEDNDFKDAKTDKRGVPVGINVPQHILDVVCIVKFNAAFRRHTSLNILHTLEDDGRINSKGAYVDFLWNKFRVTADGGLRREYRYTEDLFIDALVKAHADVATDNQKVINSMIDTEAELNKAKSPD